MSSEFGQLAGLIGVEEINKRRRAISDQAFADDSKRLEGQQLAAKTAGRLIGDAIAGADRGPAMLRAKKTEAVMKRAQASVSDEDFAESDTPQLDREEAVLKDALSNFNDDSDAVQSTKIRKRLVALRQEKRETRKEILNLTGMKTDNEAKVLDNTLKTMEIAHKGGEVPGQDELTRLQKRNNNLDLSDPQDAKMWEQNNERIKKLVTITGTTPDDPSVRDKTLLRNSLEKMDVARNGLDRLQNIQTSFDSNFLTLGGKVKNFGLGVVDFLGLDLPDDLKSEYAEYKTFAAKTIQNVNLYIMEITGAQMSKEEAKRLMKGIPNDTDTPIEFQAKMKVTMDALEHLYLKSLKMVQADSGGLANAEIDARVFDNMDDDDDPQAPPSDGVTFTGSTGVIMR